jgi:hypothetical protein
VKKVIVFLVLIFFVSGVSFAAVRVKNNLKAPATMKNLEENSYLEGEPEPGSLPRFKPLAPMLPSSVVVTPRGPGKLSSPYEFGISLGLLAGIPGGSVEFKWNQLKTGVMYAQGKDLDGNERKNALVFVDGIYRFSSPVKRDNGVYLGGGLNCLVYTTGQVQGGVGAEIYLGIDSIIGKTESVYVELGYGVIRTGFSPTINGLNAVLGYRTKI